MMERRVRGIGEAMVTTFGLGRLRPAPGTWGSLPPVLLAGALLLMGVGPTRGAEGWAWGAADWLVYHGVMLAVVAVFSLACLRWGTEAEAVHGKKDPGTVCADETAGVAIPLMLLPAGALSSEWAHWTLLLVFLSFRATDILKLPPARGLQRFAAGAGILVDDLVAGVQAMLLVQVVTRVLMQ